MRAFVIAGASLRLEPYVFPYINELITQGFDVTVFVWNRDGKEDLEADKKAHVIYYHELLDDAAPKTKKLLAFMRFRRAVLKELRTKRPDCIIVLDTQFAVLLSDVLIRKYRERFIYDMRDPSYERYSFYRKRVKKIVDASAGVFISSDGYRQYLPQSEKIHTTHNLRIEDLEMQGLRSQFERAHTPIRISFWGCVRDTGINIKLIDALANDARFLLQYFGMMSADSEQLIEYCKIHRINNVAFSGSYLPKERYGFAKSSEIIHNYYSNNYGGGNPCMGNKYYDGLLFKLPQLCAKGSFMGELVEANGVGIALELTSDFADVLWRYYNAIDWNDFNIACDTSLRKVLDEYNVSSIQLQDVIRKIMQR